MKYHRKKKRYWSLQRSFISRKKMSGQQIIFITTNPSGQWCHVLAVPTLRAAPHNPDWQPGCSSWVTSFLTVLTQPHFVWTLQVFSWLSGTNPSGLRLELLGRLSRPNYKERHFFLHRVPFKFRSQVTHITGAFHRQLAEHLISKLFEGGGVGGGGIYR